jgi:hypothetical protein
MQIIAPLKEAINLINGAFSGLINKVLPTQVYKYGYLIYNIKGTATITIKVSTDNVNWLQIYSQTLSNVSGSQVVELIGLFVKIEINANVDVGSFVSFVRSSI